MTRMGRRTQTGGVCPAAPGRRPSDWRDTDVVFLDVEGDRHDEGEWYCDENAAVDPSPPPRGLVERRAQVAVAVAVVLTAVTLFVGLAGSGRAAAAFHLEVPTLPVPPAAPPTGVAPPATSSEPARAPAKRRRAKKKPNRGVRGRHHPGAKLSHAMVQR